MGGAARLAPEQLAALGRVAKLPEARGLHLAGGSAAAFHFGHRQSDALDLFSSTPDLDLEVIRRSFLAALPDASVRGETDAMAKLVSAGAVIDIVRYPYAPLEPPRPGPAGVAVAGVRDLAAMKLAAISRRGIRRDFWDLFVIAPAVSLATMARDYVAKFGRAESDLYHVLRSLTYFADAEADPLLPREMTPALWTQIKAYFEREAPRLVVP